MTPQRGSDLTPSRGCDPPQQGSDPPQRASDPPQRAGDLIVRLGLAPHPEGGWFRETFRSASTIVPPDGRGPRSALTTIDFLLTDGQFSAWHRVASDEVWHLVEGGPLRLWLVPPTLDRISHVDLQPVGAGHAPRHAVPAHWWQAAEPLGELALVGATVAPGFDFADFAFGRTDDAFLRALPGLDPSATRLL